MGREEQHQLQAAFRVPSASERGTSGNKQTQKRKSSTAQLGSELCSVVTHGPDGKQHSGSGGSGKALLGVNIMIHYSDPQLGRQRDGMVEHGSNGQLFNAHEAASTHMHSNRAAEDLSSNQARDFANPLGSQFRVGSCCRMLHNLGKLDVISRLC